MKPSRNELRDYYILLATVSIGTTGLACAQIGPLQYHTVTAIPIFIVSLNSLVRVITLGVPDEYLEGNSFRAWRWAMHHGTGIVTAMAMTFYAFIASIFNVGRFDY